MPLFTTIIPTYNRRELLRRTLQTVLAQGKTEPEIIVVDDGSTDGTLEMLAELSPRVRTLRQANAGPGAARNLGLAQAQGEYIAFLDSDDLWFDWTLATYRRVIEEHNRPAFVAGCPLWFGEESELTKAHADEPKAEAFADYYSSGDQWRWCGVSSFVMRRDALNAVGAFALQMSGEDHDLTMKLGVAPGFVQIRSPHTFGYREHPGNLTRDVVQRYRGMEKWIEQEYSGQYPGGRERQKERWRILSQHTRSGSAAMLGGGRPDLAWNIYRRTWIWNASQLRLRYLSAMPVLILLRRLMRK